MVDLQFINLPVPIDRVEEVYEVLGRPRRTVIEPAPGVATKVVEPGADKGPVDEQLVIRAYRESPESMKRVFDYLADHPDQEVLFQELADAVGRTHRELMGTLGAFGRRKKNRYGHAESWPYKAWWDSEANHSVTIMSQEVADIINKTRRS